MNSIAISCIIFKNDHTEYNGKNQEQRMTLIKCRHLDFVTCQQNELKQLKTNDLDITLHEWRDEIYTLKTIYVDNRHFIWGCTIQLTQHNSLFLLQLLFHVSM